MNEDNVALLILDSMVQLVLEIMCSSVSIRVEGISNSIRKRSLLLGLCTYPPTKSSVAPPCGLRDQFLCLDKWNLSLPCRALYVTEALGNHRFQGHSVTKAEDLRRHLRVRLPVEPFSGRKSGETALNSTALYYELAVAADCTLWDMPLAISGFRKLENRRLLTSPEDHASMCGV